MHSRISETNRCSELRHAPKPGRVAYRFERPDPKAMIDKFAIVPILACVFALIVDPLLIFLTNLQTLQSAVSGRGPPGDQNFLASHGCDFRYIGRAKSFSPR